MPPLRTQSTVGTPARYRAALADPNRRASVPTQYLPPHLRKLRHQAQARKVLLDPTATIAGPALDLAAKRLAGLEINPQVAALKRQEGEATATNQRVAQRVHDYNQQYMASLADATGKAQGPFAEYFKGLQTAAPLAASSAQRDLAYDLAGTLRDIGTKKGELEEKRGALTTEKLMGLRQQQTENWMARETLGLKGMEAQASASAAAAKAKQEKDKFEFDRQHKNALLDIKRGIDPVTGKPLPKKPESASEALNRWKLNYAKKHGYFPKAGPTTPGKGTSPQGVKFQPPATQQKYVTAYRRAQPYAQAMKKAGVPRGEAYRRLLRGAPRVVDPKTGKVTGARPTFADLEAKVALDHAYYGKLTPVTVRQLHRYGIRAGQFGIPTG